MENGRSKIENDKLSMLLFDKLREQVDRTLHLLDLTPADKIDWRPVENTLRIGELLGHLLECLAGFCATLHSLEPDKLAHFERLRARPVNHSCGIEEARSKILEYLSHIKEGFGLLSDGDLARMIPTVFVPEGEPVLTVMLGNLEHYINHKHQLFFYLKLLGLDVDTSDLYRLRGEREVEV